jgi:hypothetical protein
LTLNSESNELKIEESNEQDIKINDEIFERINTEFKNGKTITDYQCEATNTKIISNIITNKDTKGK